MSYIDILKDKDFLLALDKSTIKKSFIKILVLNNKEDIEYSIEGLVSSGSISIDSSSTVRRCGSLSVVLSNKEDDYNNVDSYLKLNKKISILKGETNFVDKTKEEIVWFNLGIFIITGISINCSVNGYQLSISFEDKMSLLNGDCGGYLPSSVTFDSYDQILDDGTVESKKQLIFNIIQSLMIFYGNENISNIIINDVPLEIKNLVRYTGEGRLYYNASTGVFTKEETATTQSGDWVSFGQNENIGYMFTDFIFPDELITDIGSTVSNVLESLCEVLQNHEFFYDVNGKFIFQEKKNYLNNVYQNTITSSVINNLSIVNNETYDVDFSGDNKSIYDFSNNKELIVSMQNTPELSNIRNDFHIWGKRKKDSENLAIHYHLVIKDKPRIMNTWDVIFNEDNCSIRLATSEDSINNIVKYTPLDWRAELYLEGLDAIKKQQRPDIYQQEILDNFDSVYNFQEKTFKVDLVKHPTELNYFIDYLEPVGRIGKYSVDSIGNKILTIQDDEINAIFELDSPDLLLINVEDTENYSSIVEKCEKQGQPYSNIQQNIYDNVSLGTCINTAFSKVKDLLSQYTNFNEKILITCIPIPYLDVNNRIKINDVNSGIYGDYIIYNIELPLDYAGLMTIQCSKAVERI